MDSFFILLSGFATAAIILAFFGGIALLVWATHRGEAEKLKLQAERQQFEHAEQMRALDLGLPLPSAEIERLRAATRRAWAAAFVGVLVPLGLFAGAVVVTFRIVDPPEYSYSMPILFTIWGAAGLVSLVTAVLSLVTIRHAGVQSRRGAVPAPHSPRRVKREGVSASPDPMTAVQEKVVS